MRESGLDLYRCGLRFYDVANARWLTRDPIGYDGGQNLYGYVSGNPVMGADPSGAQDAGMYSYPAGMDYNAGWRYWGDVGAVVSGYGSALYGTARSPLTFTEFIGAWSGTNWSLEYGKQAVIGGFTEFWSGLIGEKGNQGFGESFGSLLIAAGTAGAPFAEGGSFSKVAYITHWDKLEQIQAMQTSGTIRPGSWVMNGRPTLFNYLLSGASEQGYKPWHYVFQKAPRSCVQAPPGAERFKYLLGQRIYKP